MDSSKSSKVANMVQIIASVGLLAGLVLVGIQINQSTELTRLQIENEWEAKWYQRQLSFMGEAPAVIWAKAIEDPEELTAAELLVAETYIDNYLEYALTIKRFYDEGLVSDDRRWRDSLSGGGANRIFGTRIAKAWWASLMQVGLVYGGDEEFTAAVTLAIEEIDTNLMEQWHQFLRQNIKNNSVEPPV